MECFERQRGRALLWLSLATALPALGAQVTRLEAKSQHLLAVGIVEADHMKIHVSRLIDNAPVRDAQVSVMIRGATHPTVAEADGSYTLADKDLAVPGTAQVEFQIASGALHETLSTRLEVGAAASAPKAEDEKSQARQYWWWALNFGVCIGFLMLLSRRKKKSED